MDGFDQKYQPDKLQPLFWRQLNASSTGPHPVRLWRLALAKCRRTETQNRRTGGRGQIWRTNGTKMGFMLTSTITGWWFGTCFMTSHILGIVTPTLFRGVETTNQIICLYIYIYTYYKIIYIYICMYIRTYLDMQDTNIIPYILSLHNSSLDMYN